MNMLRVMTGIALFFASGAVISETKAVDLNVLVEYIDLLEKAKAFGDQGRRLHSEQAFRGAQTFLSERLTPGSVVQSDARCVFRKEGGCTSFNCITLSCTYLPQYPIDVIFQTHSSAPYAGAATITPDDVALALDDVPRDIEFDAKVRLYASVGRTFSPSLDFGFAPTRLRLNGVVLSLKKRSGESVSEPVAERTVLERLQAREYVPRSEIVRALEMCTPGR